MADGSGRAIDAVAVERQSLAENGMPTCRGPILQVTHSAHSFAGGHLPWLHAYVWPDVIAAEVAAA